MATAGVFDIELNEDGTNDSDHSDEEPIKPASEEHVQVMIVAYLTLGVSLRRKCKRRNSPIFNTIQRNHYKPISKDQI